MLVAKKFNIVFVIALVVGMFKPTTVQPLSSNTAKVCSVGAGLLAGLGYATYKQIKQKQVNTHHIAYALIAGGVATLVAYYGIFGPQTLEFKQKYEKSNFENTYSNLKATRDHVLAKLSELNPKVSLSLANIDIQAQRTYGKLWSLCLAYKDYQDMQVSVEGLLAQYDAAHAKLTAFIAKDLAEAKFFGNDFKPKYGDLNGAYVATGKDLTSLLGRIQGCIAMIATSPQYKTHVEIYRQHTLELERALAEQRHNQAIEQARVAAVAHQALQLALNHERMNHEVGGLERQLREARQQLDRVTQERNQLNAARLQPQFGNYGGEPQGQPDRSDLMAEIRRKNQHITTLESTIASLKGQLREQPGNTAAQQEEAEACPICLEAFTSNSRESIFRTACNHRIHTACMGNPTTGVGLNNCPICRHRL